MNYLYLTRLGYLAHVNGTLSQKTAHYTPLNWFDLGFALRLKSAVTTVGLGIYPWPKQFHRTLKPTLTI